MASHSICFSITVHSLYLNQVPTGFKYIQEATCKDTQLPSRESRKSSRVPPGMADGVSHSWIMVCRRLHVVPQMVDWQAGWLSVQFLAASMVQFSWGGLHGPVHENRWQCKKWGRFHKYTTQAKRWKSKMLTWSKDHNHCSLHPPPQPGPIPCPWPMSLASTHFEVQTATQKFRDPQVGADALALPKTSSWSPGKCWPLRPSWRLQLQGSK